MIEIELNEYIQSLGLKNSEKIYQWNISSQQQRLCKKCGNRIQINRDPQGDLTVLVNEIRVGATRTNLVSMEADQSAKKHVAFLCRFSDAHWENCGVREAIEKIFEIPIVREKGL